MTQPADPHDPDPTDADAPDAPPAPTPGLRVVRDEEAQDPDWARALARSSTGVPTKDPGNVALILSHSAAWDGVLEHDVFADRVQLAKLPDLPLLPEGWASLASPAAGELSPEHVTYAGLWLRRRWGQSWGAEAIQAGIVYAAKLRPVHPLRDYLERCAATWDGRPRVGTWLEDYLGARPASGAERVYLSSVGRWWLVSAVARALQPGCKADHVLVLEGQQGARKNTALEALFSPWYLPELPDLRDKDSMVALAGIWCALNDELGATRRGDVERSKSFFSRSEDVYRRPYDRNTTRRPRTNVFAATTNEGEYLLDVTGNRRWWPVRVGDIRIDALSADRNDLWGEAVALYRGTTGPAPAGDGSEWWPDPTLAPALADQQDRRVQGDEWEATIARFIAGSASTTVGDCLQTALDIPPAKWTTADQQRVGRCLRRLGWQSARVAPAGATSRRRVWLPPGA